MKYLMSLLVVFGVLVSSVFAVDGMYTGMKQNNDSLHIQTIDLQGVLFSPAVAYAQEQNIILIKSGSECSTNQSTCFIPSDITITQHSAVTWKNSGTDISSFAIASGSVVGADESQVGTAFNSGIVSSSSANGFTHTFSESGTFQYFSLIQPWMSGTITVTPSAMPDNQRDDDTDRAVPGTDDDDADVTTPPTTPPSPPPTTPPSPPPAVDPQSDIEPECGEGTELVNGVCKAIETTQTGGSDGEDAGGCLIATAAYGTELAPQVQFLREIRDNTLMSTESGTSFMSSFNTIYYTFAPTVADWERQSPVFKQAVQTVITPMLSTLSIMSLAEQGSESEVLGLGISVIMLNLGMYVVAPTLIGLKARDQIKPRWDSWFSRSD